MEFVKILGCGSALPTANSFPSAQIIKNNQKYFLVDCGEGTQLRIRESKISFSKISHIFISHLHGDHFFGLPGLLSSMHLLGRTDPIKLFGPKELMSILNLQFKHSGTYLKYNIEFTAVEGKDKNLIFEDASIEIYSFPLNHRIACHGYFFQEKRKPNHILPRKMEQYQVPKHLKANIKAGDDFVTDQGKVIPHEELTSPSEEPISYAYCSDNRVKTTLAPLLKGVDYLYHETTFKEKEIAKAKKTFHSTTVEAAELAKVLHVKALLIGHYSARYTNTQELQEECQGVFLNTILGKSGLQYDFKK